MLTAVPCLEQLVTVYWKKSSSYIVEMCSVISLNSSVVVSCIEKSPTQLQIQEKVHCASPALTTHIVYLLP